MTIYACAFVVGRHGVLVRGASGSGKSLLVEECLYRATGMGLFSRWVADDQVALMEVGNGFIASAVPTIAGQRELRFSGIAFVPHVARCRLDLVVDLKTGNQLERFPEDRPTIHIGEEAASDIALPLCTVPEGDLRHACHIVMHALHTL